MKTIQALALTALFMILLSLTAISGTKQITGQVIGINKKNQTITVEGRNGTVTIKAVGKTKVIVERNTEFSKVKIGDKVTIKYDPDEKRNTAKSIEIRAQSHER